LLQASPMLPQLGRPLALVAGAAMLVAIRPLAMPLAMAAGAAMVVAIRPLVMPLAMVAGAARVAAMTTEAEARLVTTAAMNPHSSTRRLARAGTSGAP